MANEVLYTEATVLKLLAEAYRAGFEGPLEMTDETCRDILEAAQPFVPDSRSGRAFAPPATARRSSSSSYGKYAPPGPLNDNEYGDG